MIFLGEGKGRLTASSGTLGPSKEGAELGAESSEFGHQWLGSSGRPQVSRMGEVHMETEGKRYSICKWRQFGDHTMEGWGR